MSINILSEQEQDSMRAAGRIAALTLRTVCQNVRVGMSTGAIDRLVRSDTQLRGAVPSQLGYCGFPAAVCTSKNEVVCHGIPRDDVFLASGDIINIDVTSQYGGFVGDTSNMVLVGDVSDEARRLCDVARRAVEAGIDAIHPGGYMVDIAIAVSELAKKEGCSVVREFGGHGIGRKMHLPPHVSYVPGRGRGARLRVGMAFTIEPMINLGGPAVTLLDDGWTVVTADGALSAQYEHTVLVVPGGAEVLTRLENE